MAGIDIMDEEKPIEKTDEQLIGEFSAMLMTRKANMDPLDCVRESYRHLLNGNT